MLEIPHSEQIGKQVQYTEYHDPKFRRCLLTLCFFFPHSAETASACSLLPDLLVTASAAYPTLSSLAMRLDELYAAELSAEVSVLGDSACLQIRCAWMDDAFALDGECITDAVLELLLGCLFAPNAADGNFEEIHFRICKQNLLDDIACFMDDKRAYAASRAAEIAFRGEPAAVREHGSKETAEALTPAQTFRQWQALLRSAPVDIVCILPGEKPQIRERLTKAFASVFREVQPLPLLAPSPCKLSPCVEQEESPMSQTRLVLVWKYGEMSRPLRNMLHHLLSGSGNSLLFRNVREQQGLCYDCAAGFTPFKAAMTIECGIQETDVDAAISAILAQIAALRTGGFDDAQMREAVINHASRLKLATDRQSEITAEILRSHMWRTRETAEEQIAAMKAVTKAQIAEAAESLQLDTVYILRGTAEGKETA